MTNLPILPAAVVSKEPLREAINDVFELFNNSVCRTLGPKGKLVLYKRVTDTGYVTTVTKDGVTVCKALHDQYTIYQMIIEIIREASISTLLEAGDGTTSTIKLAYEFWNVLKDLTAKEIEEQLKVLDSILTLVYRRKNVFPLKKDNWKNVLKVSSNNDQQIVNNLFNIYDRIGEDGLVRLVVSPHLKNDIISFSKGIKVNVGLLFGSKFVTDGKRRECHLNESFVFIYPGILQSFNHVASVLKPVIDYNADKKDKKDLLIICKNYSEIALHELTQHHKSYGFNICPIAYENVEVTPGFILEDIAQYCNTKIYGDVNGYELGYCKLEDFGSASSIVVSQNNTFIESDGSNQEEFKSYLEALLSCSKNKDLSDKKREEFNERYCSLTKGTALITLGGGVISELMERRDRYDDAICSFRGALEEGIVQGGGAYYKYLYDTINTTVKFKTKFEKAKPNLLKALVSIYDLINKEDKAPLWVKDSFQVILSVLKNSISLIKVLLSLDACVIAKNEPIIPNMNIQLTGR